MQGRLVFPHSLPAVIGSHERPNRTCFFFTSRPSSLSYSSELATIAQEPSLDSSSVSTSNTSLTRSLSNPDLSISSNGNKSQSSSSSIFNGSAHDEDNAVFVVKVYRSDQSSKYFTVHKVSVAMRGNGTRSSLFQETTAKQLVMLAITEFGIIDQSRYRSFSSTTRSLTALCYSL